MLTCREFHITCLSLSLSRSRYSNGIIRLLYCPLLPLSLSLSLHQHRFKFHSPRKDDDIQLERSSRYINTNKFPTILQYKFFFIQNIVSSINPSVLLFFSTDLFSQIIVKINPSGRTLVRKAR